MTYTYIADAKFPLVGYFARSCKTDGTRNSLGPAPDGEEYFVVALYLPPHAGATEPTSMTITLRQIVCFGRSSIAIKQVPPVHSSARV